MGILDDAIREHLELRRRNGADTEEVQQLEQNLLHDGPQAEDEAPAAAAPVAPEPEPLAEPEPEPVAEAAPEPEPAFELAPVEQPTRQFTAAEVEAAEDRPAANAPADPAEHDELEETPDFLQETPEHDRLWFEQKPPKDFDF
jgi:hypothetical protein